MKRCIFFKLCFLLTLIAFTVISCKNRKNLSAENLGDYQNVFMVPFKNIHKENTTYQIGTDRDTILYYETGSRLLIPQNAFLAKDGNPINGYVKLTYREFSDAFDIYMGGIPMQYDSAGVEQVLETAGMIEINAYSDGQSVFVNPDNKIKVEMTSFDPDSRFNVYSLDTTTGQWSYLGKDKVNSTTYADELEKLPQVPPVPKKAGPYAFTIRDGTGEVPELDIYKNVLFEPVDGKKHGFQSTKIKVKDLKNGKYLVTFILFVNKDILKKDSCECYLSFKEGENYDIALNAYRNKYARQIEIRGNIWKNIDDEWKQYNDAVKSYRRFFFNKEISGLTGERKISRAFEVSGFGFVNIDFPSAYPSGAELSPVFKDSAGNNLQLRNVVLVEYGRNALYRYQKTIKFNPKRDNIIWGITGDNKLAIFKVDEFKRIDKYSGAYTFVMKVYPDTLDTYEEICNALFE